MTTTDEYFDILQAPITEFYNLSCDTRNLAVTIQYLTCIFFVYGFCDGRTDKGQRRIEIRQMNETLKIFCNKKLNTNKY